MRRERNMIMKLIFQTWRKEYYYYRVAAHNISLPQAYLHSIRKIIKLHGRRQAFNVVCNMFRLNSILIPIAAILSSCSGKAKEGDQPPETLTKVINYLDPIPIKEF